MANQQVPALGVIDHIDRNRKNDSRINIALSTASLNARNHKVISRNTSGTNRVNKLKTGKWKSSRYYREHGRSRRVDTTFDTEEEAIQD